MYFYPTLPHHNLLGSTALFSIMQSSSAVPTMPAAGSCSPAYSVQPPQPRASLPTVSGRNLEVYKEWHGAPAALSPALLQGGARQEVIMARPLQLAPCANSLQASHSKPISSLADMFCQVLVVLQMCMHHN